MNPLKPFFWCKTLNPFNEHPNFISMTGLLSNRTCTNQFVNGNETSKMEKKEKEQLGKLEVLCDHWLECEGVLDWIFLRSEKFLTSRRIFQCRPGI